MPNAVENQPFPPFFTDFRQLLLEKEYWDFGQTLNFKMSDFPIRKPISFRDRFRLVRKTLLIGFPAHERIWSDRRRVMNRNVPKSNLFAKKAEVWLLVKNLDENLGKRTWEPGNNS